MKIAKKVRWDEILTIWPLKARRNEKALWQHILAEICLIIDHLNIYKEFGEWVKAVINMETSIEDRGTHLFIK